jgi:hypothetical protein
MSSVRKRFCIILFIALSMVGMPAIATLADEPAPAAAPVEPAAAEPAEPVPPVEPDAPTYTIFATCQGLVGRRTANGHRIVPRDRFVALPSWSVLSSRGGNEFQVRLTYKDRTVVVPVWDVGPWNTKDDYWSPNRRYSDLPVGLPMAQAAYQNGYNGGRDSFGRYHSYGLARTPERGVPNQAAILNQARMNRVPY